METEGRKWNDISAVVEIAFEENESNSKEICDSFEVSKRIENEKYASPKYGCNFIHGEKEPYGTNQRFLSR